MTSTPPTDDYDPPEAVGRHLDAHEDALVERTLALLAVDTTNPPGETAALVADVEADLEEQGLTVEQVVADPVKPNLVARLPGERSRTLSFVGHLDTVPVDDSAWTHDPFGERDGDRIYGRGATDMKGAVAAMLSVARAYAETGTRPPVSLEFALVSDEEVAGDAGLPAVLAAGALDADWCVIGETTCDAGRHSVTVADKGSVWLTLEATGDPAHGSRPMLGTNAIDRLYDAVETIREEFGTQRLDPPADVAPIVEESIEYYEPTLGEAVARDLFAYPTINLGVLRGGESVNQVPGSARAELDIRLPAGVETPAILRRIRACADECEGIHIAEVSWSVGTYEPIDGELVTAVTDVAAGVTGERVFRRSATGGGDAKTLRNADVETVEFGLGTDTAHAVDEYTTVEALRANAAVYAALPRRLAASVG